MQLHRPAVTPLTYVLPIRASAPPTAELTSYVRLVGRHHRLIIVDGSDPAVFAANHAAWSSAGVHVAPTASVTGRNGKVRGVLTALPLVATEGVVIADDDVRYTIEGLRSAASALGGGDVVVPQNYFRPLPWHARWDTARTLINRATGGDFPGTLIVRTAVLRAAGGYDGDVLFENLELMRTVEAVGGTVLRRPDLYVRRLPPTAAHFVGQRIRQAYDEFARPGRLVITLAMLPAGAWSLRRRPAATLVAGITAAVATAELGRRRHGGRRWFPWTSSLLAPLWVTERAVCAWLAVGARLRGGVVYGPSRMRLAAHRPAHLREVVRRAAVLHVGARPEPGVVVSACRERGRPERRTGTTTPRSVVAVRAG